MDDQLRLRIREMATRLAEDESGKLEAAGTFVDLERLTVEIGDELTRQLTSSVLAARAQQVARQPLHACPECGKECAVQELDPLILKGMRGEVEYAEPRCFCSSCRRSFFPGGANTAASRA
jgi:hypothetical protein